MIYGDMPKIVALLALSIRLVVAQSATQVNSNVTICNWAGLRSGIIRDTIYLDGGSLWWQSGTNGDGLPILTNDGGTDGLMFSLNLSYAFDTTTFNKTTSLLQPMSKTGGTAGNNIAPRYVDGAMFANDAELYLYGGLIRLTDAFKTPPDADAVLGYEAYQYGPPRSTWSRGFLQSTLPANVTRYVSNGAAVSVPSENLGFYFGGIRGANWGPITESTDDWYLANTLIDVDMSTMRGEQWSNNTISRDVPPRAGAELVWIPVGGQGVLVAMGGMIAVEDRLPAGLNSSQISDAERQAPGFMTSLPVYDIVSKTWYMQNTTGDGPGQLTEFCSVVAPAKDFSSFNVYIYGGYDGLNSTSIPSNDVWILSIPSFTWVKAYSGVPGQGRRGHKCERIYPDQMLIIGGVNPNPSVCIEGGPIQVFNLNTLKTQNLYDPREWSEYAVPDVVTAVIGGNSQGGSTKTTTFSDNALSSLFKTPYTKAKIQTYYPYSAASGTPGATPVPTPIASSGGLAKWVAPVLGVVLGLVVLSIIAVLILLYRRRKMRGRNSLTSSNTGSAYNNPILNWVMGMPNPSSHPKTDPSVSSTEAERDGGTVSSPVAGRSEVAGKERYEVEALEREKPIAAVAEMPAEVPASYQVGSRSNHTRGLDWARDAVTSPSSSKYSQPSTDRSASGHNTPQPQPHIHGLGLHSPTNIVSPQTPTHNHVHSNSNGGGSSSNNNIGAGSGGHPSPYVQPHSPEDVGSRSPTASPSLPSSAAVSPDLKTSSHHPNPGGGSGSGDNPGGGGGLRHRPSHTRNVSSLSSHLYQLPSPDIVLSPDEALRRREESARIVGGAGLSQHPSGMLGALDSGPASAAAAAAAADGVTTGRYGELVSPEEGVPIFSPKESSARRGLGGGLLGGAGGGGVERQKTSPVVKKSSFGEMLDERK